MNKKTLRVAEYIEQVNYWLRRDTISQLEKKALCVSLEWVLNYTNNYAGFNYNFRWSEASAETRTNREYDRHYNVLNSLQDEYTAAMVARLKRDEV